MSFANTHPKIAPLHPEVRVGEYTALDGTVEFYGRIKSLTSATSVVLDYGAGRGAWFEDDASEFRRQMRLLRGTAAEVIGCDVDTAVLENRAVDRAFVVAPNSKLPLEDDSVDVVVADYVLEHIDEPGAFAEDVRRVLKPGGWFCARTPTRFNYVAIGARLLASSRHGGVLEAAQPGRRKEDAFPTRYQLNSLAALARCFPPEQFEHCTYTYCTEPQYHFGRVWVYRLLEFAHWALPRALTGNLFVFIRKR